MRRDARRFRASRQAAQRLQRSIRVVIARRAGRKLLLQLKQAAIRERQEREAAEKAAVEAAALQAAEAAAEAAAAKAAAEEARAVAAAAEAEAARRAAQELQAAAAAPLRIGPTLMIHPDGASAESFRESLFHA